MIVVRLKGGVGNQMFQYAAGRSLALRHDVALKLDAAACRDKDDRRFALEDFTIDAGTITPGELDALLNRQCFLARILRKQVSGNPLRHVIETTFHFDPEFALLTDDVYLDGYWQSELYFKDYINQIRKDFMFRAPLEEQNAELAMQIESCTAVALHVRRGDYVTSVETGAWHGVCSVNYYQQCIERMESLCENPVFYVFSDDLPWASRNLSLPEKSIFVDGNQGARSIMDLHLMSLCRHHIIANSSFSWWGAWLAETPGQVVMAPEPWFRTKNIDARDLIPARWTRVEFVG